MKLILASKYEVFVSIVIKQPLRIRRGPKFSWGPYMEKKMLAIICEIFMIASLR